MSQPSKDDQATTSAVLSSFANSADTYERRIGRATRAVAAHIVTKALGDLPEHSVIHDNACGTGAVTDELLKVYPAAHIEATDAAPPMVDIVNAQMQSRGLSSQIQGSVMDGAELKFPDDKFDASVTNFGIFFLPEPVKGMKEIHRTLKPGGIAVLTCWERLSLIYDIFVGIERLIKPGTEFKRPDFLLKWQDSATMEGLLKEAGFGDVEIGNVKVLLWGNDVDDLAASLGENMRGFIGEEYTAEEKDRCIPCAKEYLENQGKPSLIHEADKVGVRMSAWVAMVRK